MAILSDLRERDKLEVNNKWKCPFHLTTRSIHCQGSFLNGEKLPTDSIKGNI